MLTMIQTHGKVICYRYKLGLTAAIGSKAMLMITEDIVTVNIKKCITRSRILQETLVINIDL